MSLDPPPWFVQDQNGHIDILAVPERLKLHPELQRRGIVLTDPLKPGFVYTTFSLDKTRCVVKILNPATEEKAIYERLLRLDCASPNHTVPCDLSKEGHPLLIMPSLSDFIFLGPRQWSLWDLLGIFLQLVEGVQFLHDQRIVHMDICPGNVLAASKRDACYDKRLVAGKMYIIDFDSSRQFARGSGEQHAIKLPPTQVHPPKGLEHFDPYSWDMYCLGVVLKEIVQGKYYDDLPPCVVRIFVQWLLGDERGCTTVCRCRPSASRARRVLVSLRSFVYVHELRCRYRARHSRS